MLEIEFCVLKKMEPLRKTSSYATDLLLLAGTIFGCTNKVPTNIKVTHPQQVLVQLLCLFFFSYLFFDSC